MSGTRGRRRQFLQVLRGCVHVQHTPTIAIVAMASTIPGDGGNNGNGRTIARSRRIHTHTHMHTCTHTHTEREREKEREREYPTPTSASMNGLSLSSSQSVWLTRMSTSRHSSCILSLCASVQNSACICILLIMIAGVRVYAQTSSSAYLMFNALSCIFRRPPGHRPTRECEHLLY